MADIVGTGGIDTLVGTGDADTITALAGNDTVNAGDGADIINGGTGNDTLNGEGGDDTFIEDTITSSLDRFDGGSGFDTIELRAVTPPLINGLGSLSPHSFSSATSMVSIERLLYASQAGQVLQAQMLHGSFAGTGLTQIVGGAGRDLFVLQTGPTGGTFSMLNLPISNWDSVSINAWEHSGDFVILSGASLAAGQTATLNALAGATFMQSLNGGAGNDTINGSGNADLVDATRGADIVNAGGGNDSIAIVNSAAPVGGNSWGPPSTFNGAGGVWDGGDGTDVISIGGAVNLQATLLNIEGVNLLPAFIPPAFNTTIQYAAELTLDAVHFAMLPANAFFSGEGTVRFVVDSDESFSAANYVVTAGAEVDFIIDAGTGDGLIFTGSARDDTINLGNGAQIAFGGLGDDVLNNGAGPNAMYGEDGDDILIFDNSPADNIILDGGAGTDLLQLHSGSVTNPVSADIVHRATSLNGGLITGVEAVQFVSVAGRVMTLIVDWNAGFSSIIGGTGFDRLIFGVGSAGTYTMPSFSLFNWNPGDFVGLGVTSTTTFSVTLNGRNDISQYLYGGLAADTLNGGALADFLIGGGGADILNGNDGADQFVLGTGAAGATYNGGNQADSLIVNGAAVSVGALSSIETIQFVLPGSNLTLTGSQLASGLAVNAVLGGAGTLTVNMDVAGSLVTKLFSFSGGSAVNIVVNGTTGNDNFKLGNALHTINAGDGTDQVKGGNLVDTINGGSGVDKINGAGGADILTGGSGNDVFKYAAASDSGLGAAADRITDYAIGGDRMNFAVIDTNAGLAGDQGFAFVATGAFSGGGVASIRYGNSGADLLVQADLNGDGVADMEIILQGLSGGTLTAADFVL